MPLISIVIATYNRALHLQRCLPSLERLDYEREAFEVIVVDDGSRDETPQVLAAFKQATQLHFTYISQANSGPAAARNKGVAVAHGEFIAFTDDDCVPEVGWVKELLAAFSAPTIGGVGGQIKDVAHNTISRYLELHHVVASDLSGELVPSFLITANACYRRKCLMEAGGFDERFKHPGGEDPDLSYRVTGLGYTLAFCEQAVVHHYHKTGFREFAKSYYHYGQGYGYVQQKHKLVGGSAWNWRQVWRWLSPRGLGYRAKRYVADRGARWQDAVSFAFLDGVRELAWLRGYADSQARPL